MHKRHTRLGVHHYPEVIHVADIDSCSHHSNTHARVLILSHFAQITVITLTSRLSLLHTQRLTPTSTTCSTDGTSAHSHFLLLPQMEPQTQCFHTFDIAATLSPGAFLLTYKPLTDTTLQHHSPQAMLRSTSPQPHPPIPCFHRV